MARGALVGREGPWLGACVGALYAANLRVSTAHSEEFRFAVPPPSLGVLTRLYGALNAGEVPVDLTPEEWARVEFHMDYPDSMAKRLLPFGKGARERGLPELLLGAVPLVGAGGPLAPAEVGWTALRESTVIVLQAQVQGLNAGPGPVDEDSGLAAVVEALARASAGRKLKVAVLWWLPGRPPPRRDEEKKETPAIPPPAEGPARATLHAALMARHLPQTAAALQASGAPHPAPFFGWVETEARQGVVRVTRRQLFDVGGVEPEYPFDEFEALIQHLGRLAA